MCMSAYSLLAVVGPLALPPALLVVAVFGVCVLGVVFFGAGLLRGKK